MTVSDKGPLFLVGTGRCGSTIVYSCLAMHPDFAWISSWLTVVPRLPLIAAANRFWDLPGTDRFRETRFLPKPVEPNLVFEPWAHTYRREDAASDVVDDSREHLVPLVAKLQRYHGKPRFLCKLVGRPVKVTLLASLFPGARFLHITRGLKPTTSSLLLVDFYRGTGFVNWPWGEIPPTYLEFYESRGRPAEVAAAITLQLTLLELDRQLGALDPGRAMELPYADFVADPLTCVGRLAEWAGFEASAAFLRRIRARRLYGGADEKWRKHFQGEQRRNLDDFEALVAANPGSH